MGNGGQCVRTVLFAALLALGLLQDVTAQEQRERCFINFVDGCNNHASFIDLLDDTAHAVNSQRWLTTFFGNACISQTLVLFICWNLRRRARGQPVLAKFSELHSSAALFFPWGFLHFPFLAPLWVFAPDPCRSNIHAPHVQKILHSNYPCLVIVHVSVCNHGSRHRRKSLPITCTRIFRVV